MISRLSTGVKLGLGVGVICILLVVQLASSVILGSKLTSRLEIMNVMRQATNLAKDIRFHGVQIQQFLTDGSLTREPDAEKEAVEHLQRGHAKIRELSTLLPGEKLSALASDLDSLYNVGTQMLRAYSKSAEAGNKIMTAPDSGFDAMAERCSANSERLVAEMSASSEKAMQEALAFENSIARATWIISVVLLLVQLIIAFVLRNSIVGSITTLVSEAGQLVNAAKEGRLSVRADCQKINFEFRPILDGFNQVLELMLAPIQEATVVLEKLSDRDLTVRVKGEFLGDHANIKNKLNIAGENLQGALVQVSQAVEQVTAASTEIATGSQSLAQGASEQASSLEQISSSIEEISSMVRQNMENASQANILAGTAKEQAEQGNGAMAKMSEAIQKIKDSSDETAKIIKTIDEIAFQTNLLALNAAVEAARAGDAGKGFAVVAEEVRNLAQRSAEAARNTSALIEGSQSNADNGVAVTTQVSEMLRQIVDGVQKVAHIIAEVSASATEQAKGIDQINKGILEMNKVTQQNASLSEQSASAAEELNAQSEELAKLVSAFVLAGGSDGSHSVPRSQGKPNARTSLAAKRPVLLRPVAGSGEGTGTPQTAIPLTEEDLKKF